MKYKNWDPEEEKYIIENYGRKLSVKEIARHLNTAVHKVWCKAAHLRKKGYPVFRYSFINWRDPEMKELLFEIYGGIPTHQLAESLGTTVAAIHAATGRLRTCFKGSEGRYTFGELAGLLKIDGKAVKKWTGLGLKISSYAKDSITKPRKSSNAKGEPRYYYALIDLSDLKKFLKRRPEAYDLSKLDEKTKHFLELSRLKITWKEKEVCCKKCDDYFWTNLYNNHPRCPKCRRIASKWAINYR